MGIPVLRRARVRRTAVVGLVALATVVAGAGAALAGSVGVDGVGLRVDLPRDADTGRGVLDLGRGGRLNVEVANHAGADRRVRVYAVAVTESDGAFELDAEGSADWLGLAEELELAPGERVTLSTPVQAHRVPDDVVYAAAVVEHGTGTTVVGRAASVFHVRGHDAAAGVDGPATVAVLLLGAVLLGHLLRVRGRVEARLTGRR